jgi:hypothetical protein
MMAAATDAATMAAKIQSSQFHAPMIFSAIPRLRDYFN